MKRALIPLMFLALGCGRTLASHDQLWPSYRNVAVYYGDGDFSHKTDVQLIQEAEAAAEDLVYVPDRAVQLDNQEYEVNVLAETYSEEPCVQQYYPAPTWIQSDLIQGIILPASVTDPNTFLFSAPVGPFKRLGRGCDPDGHPFVVVSQSEGWDALFDALVGNWLLEGVVKPGPNYVYVRAIDDPGPYVEPAIEHFTVLIWGIEERNNAPVLH